MMVLSYFMKRSDEYKNALRIQHRLQELKEIHKWSDKETSMAFKACNEPMAMNLHTVGLVISLLHLLP